MASFRRIFSLLLMVVLGTTPIAVRAEGPSDSAYDVYRAAAKSYADSDWRQAADQFRSIVDAHPDDAQASRARFFLGESLVQLGQHREASQQFKRCLASDIGESLRAKATFRLGETYFLSQQIELAEEPLDRFAKTWPDDPMVAYALMYLGDVALASGDTAGAEERYRDQLNRFPAGPVQYDVRLSLARSYELQQRDDDAIVEYETVAANGDADQVGTALFDLATLCFRQQQYDRAAETVERLASTLPEHQLVPRATLTGGWAKLRLGDLAGARISFERLVADDANPDDSLRIEARYGLALVAIEKGDDAKVVDVFDGLQLDPAHPLSATIAYQRADALRRTGDTEAALAGFEQLLDQSTDDEWSARAQVAVLDCLLTLQRYDALQDRAHELLTVADSQSDDATTANIRRLLAQGLAEQGEHAGAVDVLGPLVESAGPTLISPDDLYRLAVSRFNQGDHDEALRLLEQLSAESMNITADRRAAIRQLHVAVLVEAKRFDEAVAVLDGATSGDMAAIERRQIALLYAEVKQFAKAAQQFDVVSDDTERDDSFWTAVASVADRALDSGDSTTAARMYRQMAVGSASAEVSAAGWLGRARCEWQCGRSDTALAALGRITEQHAESAVAADADLLRARILADTRGGDPALVALEHAAEAHAGTPAAASALLRLAQMYEDAAQDDDAANAYMRYVDEYPTATGRATAMLRCGMLLTRLGRDGEANVRFESLIDEYPDGSVATSARLRLARSALDRRDFARASELVDAVLGTDVVGELTADALYLRGLIAVAERRWIDVDVSMRRLLDEYPECQHRLGAEYWLSEAAYRRGDFARAEQFFDELIRKTYGRNERLTAMARLRRTQLLARKRQWSDVIDRGESLLADFPDFAQRYEIDYLLGRAHVGQADFQRAREAFGRVVRSPSGGRTETAAMAQWMIGESYFHQRDYASARQAFLRVDGQYDDFPHWQAAALLEAGKCSQQLEDWGEAARQFDQVVQHHPDSAHFGEAQQRLRLAEQKTPSRRQATR